MLHQETVEPATLVLLEELMMIDELSHFALAGGTNLSLCYGHRMSIDIDLFTDQDFDQLALRNVLTEKYDDISSRNISKNTIICMINGIKVDCIKQGNPYIGELKYIPSGDAMIRMYSLEDVIAMKCSALLGRGVKKDYRDLSYILQDYTLAHVLDCFSRRFPKADPGTALRSLMYFDEADQDHSQVLALDGMTRDKVKQNITHSVQQYFNSLH